MQSQVSAKQRNAILKTLEKTGYWHGELVQLNKSGKELTGLCTVSQLKDGDGNITGNLILIKDITQLKRASKALARLNMELEQKVIERTQQLINTEKKYEQLFDTNPMPLWVINQNDFSFMAVNQMATFQYGYSREEFLAMTAVDIRPEDERKTFMESDHTFITSSSNYNKGIWKHKKKDGSTVYVEVFAHDAMFENTPVKMVLSVDVTGRLKAEKELAAREVFYRSLIENSHEGISLVDKDYNSIYRSPAAEKLAAEMDSAQPLSRVHPDDDEIMENLRRQLGETSGTPLPFLGRFLLRDQTYIWLEGTANNLLQLPGVNAIVVNFRNVTERIAAEQKVLAGEKQFRNALNQMMEGVQIQNRDWHYTFVNDALVRYSRTTREKLLSSTMMEIYPGIEDTAIFAAMKRVMNEGKQSKWKQHSFILTGMKAISG